MKLFWFRISTLLMLICIAGCGGSGSTAGTGNTVSIQASLQVGAPGVIFATTSSATSTAFTIDSTTFPTNGTIPNSNVNINRISYRYVPNSTGAPAFTPTVTSISYSGVITPGGSLDIENFPILWPQDYALFADACNGNNFQYDVTVTFSGIEVNTGTALSTNANISVLCF